MEPQEKLVLRARLMASGVFHRSQYGESEEMHIWLQLLAEQLVGIKETEVAANIRESLHRCGLYLPELGVDTSSDAGQQVENNEGSCVPVVEQAPPHCQYFRRAGNQVSEYTEVHIRELLSRGLSKSAVARALRVNRRVVIRVAREAQSAQQTGLTKV